MTNDSQETIPLIHQLVHWKHLLPIAIALPFATSGLCQSIHLSPQEHPLTTIVLGLVFTALFFGVELAILRKIFGAFSATREEIRSTLHLDGFYDCGTTAFVVSAIIFGACLGLMALTLNLATVNFVSTVTFLNNHKFLILSASGAVALGFLPALSRLLKKITTKKPQ